MNARATAFAFALLAVGLTAAQDVWPARDWYHSWQYVAIVAIAILVMVVHAARSWRGREGAGGKRVALALAGAVVVAVAGLLSGLIGPDTVTVLGTPGTVTPVADLGAAAFFAAVDPASIQRGNVPVIVRRRDAAAVAVGTNPVPLGLWVASTQLRPAAYVVVRDTHGNRLTVTQPNNSAFLSPVILFRQTQQIRDRSFPLDTFAVPAAHRVVHILYFSPSDLAAFPHDAAAPLPAEPGAILSVTDDAGAQRGITMALSGHEVTLGGLRMTVTLGTYPMLLLASAPQPVAMLGGGALFIAAALWGLIARVPRERRSSAPLAPEQA